MTLRTRKFIRNPLLGRKQMVVCVHPIQYPRNIGTATHRPSDIESTYGGLQGEKETVANGVLLQ